ncbi:hypothetical protein DFH09DRAFT_1080035 [Mycena vulgaris]|nr:hypothetical protein DFH09DRAFT_1080035 [Mycena vulgaris]
MEAQEGKQSRAEDTRKRSSINNIYRRDVTIQAEGEVRNEVYRGNYKGSDAPRLGFQPGFPEDREWGRPAIEILEEPIDALIELEPEKIPTNETGIGEDTREEELTMSCEHPHSYSPASGGECMILPTVITSMGSCTEQLGQEKDCAEKGSVAEPSPIEGVPP